MGFDCLGMGNRPSQKPGSQRPTFLDLIRRRHETKVAIERERQRQLKQQALAELASEAPAYGEFERVAQEALASLGIK